jgi:PTH2 family peptidyl-tRNA hydrolase
MFKWLSSSPKPDLPRAKQGETVQYLIVRQDLEMSPGKMGAQCSHASSSIALAQHGVQRHIRGAEHLGSHQQAHQQWVTTSFAKVVLRAKRRQDLLKVCDQLDEANIPYATIFDACRTELSPEEPNGSTLTCIGISPLFRDDIPPFLRKLQVFK